MPDCLKLVMEKTKFEIEKLIEDKFNWHFSKIESSLKAIEAVLLGDGQYNKTGMKQQHDEIWLQHSRFRDSGIYKDLEELIKIYASFKTVVAILGITSISALITSILSLLKLFKII